MLKETEEKKKEKRRTGRWAVEGASRMRDTRPLLRGDAWLLLSADAPSSDAEASSTATPDVADDAAAPAPRAFLAERAGVALASLSEPDVLRLRSCGCEDIDIGLVRWFLCCCFLWVFHCWNDFQKRLQRRAFFLGSLDSFLEEFCFQFFRSILSAFQYFSYLLSIYWSYSQRILGFLGTTCFL